MCGGGGRVVAQELASSPEIFSPEEDTAGSEVLTLTDATTEDRLFHAKKLFTVHVHAIDPTIALLPARNREFSARSNSCCS